MTQGLAATLDLLAGTENEAAVDLLLPALDHPWPSIREGALDALLKRRSQAGHRELVRRMHLIDDRWKAIIDQHRGSMSHALRDAVLSGDAQICQNGCQAILWFHEYDLMPGLVNALEDEGNANAELAARTVMDLTELFYAELAGPREYRPRRDPQILRGHLTACLEESTKRFNRHKKTEPVEAFLMLAARDNATLKQILLDPRHSSYLPVIDVLSHSQRPGVMRLVLSYLEDQQAPSAALTVMAHRTDRKFIEHLLRKIGSEPSAIARHNLGRIDQIRWLRDGHALLDDLDDAGQHSTVQMVMASGMKRLDAFETIRYLVTKGKVAGRRAATAALVHFHGAEANQLVTQALQDEDPRVQSLALGQLRERGIPSALTILIDLLESPQRLVREAARESLGEFNFQRYLGAFDLLEDDVRRSTGQLVKKIDPGTLTGLRDELSAASRRKRIRAAQVAVVMEFAPVLEAELIALLADEDHLVRVEAARALQQCSSTEAMDALSEAMQDKSLAVRAAAEQSLQHIEGRRTAGMAAAPEESRHA